MSTALAADPAAFGAHPIADLFPMMIGQELQELSYDIRANGLLEPIVLHEAKILDGRNRYAACEIAGVSPRFVTWSGQGDSPLRFVLSHNLHRRHLTTSQRAAIAAEVLPMFQEEARKRQEGSRAKPGEQIGVDQKTHTYSSGTALRARDEAAEMMNVSGVSVGRAKRLRENAPDEFEKVKAGEKTVNAALRDAGIADTNFSRQPEQVGVSTRRAQERRVAHLTRALAAVHATCTALANVDVPAGLPDEIKQRANGELREAVNSVNRFRRLIEES